MHGPASTKGCARRFARVLGVKTSSKGVKISGAAPAAGWGLKTCFLPRYSFCYTFWEHE